MSPNNDRTQRYNLRSRRRLFNELFRDPLIHESLLRELDYWQILKLEVAGVRAGLGLRTREQLYAGVRNRCDLRVDYQTQRRRNRNLQVPGDVQCPNTNINCQRLKLCGGSLKHSGLPYQWDHEQSLGFGGRWPPLITYRLNVRHPPGRGQQGAAYWVCSECSVDGRSDYTHPLNNQIRRAITDMWVPLCKTHSLELWDKMYEGERVDVARAMRCRCLRDITCDWVCKAHRDETLANIQRRANHHIDWLRRNKLRDPPRSRPPPNLEFENRTEKQGRHGVEKIVQWYVDNRWQPNPRPCCPMYQCGKPSWESQRDLKRLAKCLGCGGTQTCAGLLGDLWPGPW